MTHGDVPDDGGMDAAEFAKLMGAMPDPPENPLYQTGGGFMDNPGGFAWVSNAESSRKCDCGRCERGREGHYPSGWTCEYTGAVYHHKYAETFEATEKWECDECGALYGDKDDAESCCVIDCDHHDFDTTWKEERGSRIEFVCNECGAEGNGTLGPIDWFHHDKELSTTQTAETFEATEWRNRQSAESFSANQCDYRTQSRHGRMCDADEWYDECFDCGGKYCVEHIKRHPEREDDFICLDCIDKGDSKDFSKILRQKAEMESLTPDIVDVSNRLGETVGRVRVEDDKDDMEDVTVEIENEYGDVIMEGKLEDEWTPKIEDMDYYYGESTPQDESILATEHIVDDDKWIGHRSRNRKIAIQKPVVSVDTYRYNCSKCGGTTPHTLTVTASMTAFCNLCGNDFKFSRDAESLSAEDTTSFLTILLGTTATLLGLGLLSKKLTKKAEFHNETDEPMEESELIMSPNTGDLSPANYEELVVESTGFAVDIIPMGLDGSFMGSRFNALPTDRYIDYNEPGIGAHTDIALTRNENFREPEQSMVQASETEVKETQAPGQSPYFQMGHEPVDMNYRVLKETTTVSLDPAVRAFIPQSMSGYTGQKYAPPSVYEKMFGLGVSGITPAFVSGESDMGANRFGSRDALPDRLSNIGGPLSDSVNAGYTDENTTKSLAQWSIENQVQAISDTEAVVIDRASGARKMIRRV